MDFSLFISNNLGVLARFLGQQQINPKAIPLHFIFREVSGRQTYFRNISRLLPGERLHKLDTHLQTELCYTLKNLVGDAYGLQPVQPVPIDEFFDQVKMTMGRYLKVIAETGLAWTNLLSGGVDLSFLQLAINSQLPPGIQPTSHTAALNVASFVPEIEYARAASKLLGTQHTFVPVRTNDFADWLITAIKILGQPPGAAQAVYMTAFYASMASQPELIKYMFMGMGANSLHGLDLDLTKYSLFIKKYRPWMLGTLSLPGRAAPPVFSEKSLGAQRVIDMLRALRDPDLPAHPLDSVDVSTNWEMMIRCFTSDEIRDALSYHRDLEVECLNSAHLIDKTHVTDLVSDTVDAASFNNQLALGFGSQVISPFLDDAILLATFRFDPRERFFKDGRNRPITKQILEMHKASGLTKSRKLSGGIADLFDWMRNGVLNKLVCDIKQPSFLSISQEI